MLYKICPSWFCTAMLVALLPFHAYSAESLSVKSEQMRCVLANATSYLQTDKPVIVIILELCPEPNPSVEAIASLGQNVREPDRPSLSDGASASSVLTLTPTRLECLSQIYNGGGFDDALSGEVINVDSYC